MALLQLVAAAQTKRPVKKPVPGTATDSVANKALIDRNDTLDPRDVQVKAGREFAVYNKRERGVDKRLKLCFQLTGDTVFNFCFNDSTVRDPEYYDEIFRKKDGDTTYVLLFIDAFTKATEKLCDGGKETRLLFIEWNTKKNTAQIRQRTISSCIKAISNMTKMDIREWDKKSPLVVSYHRGGQKFIDARFDPSDYKKGMQTISSDDQEEEQ